MRLTKITIALLVTGLAACGQQSGTSANNPPHGPIAPHALKHYTSCDELAQGLKERIKLAINEAMDAQIPSENCSMILDTASPDVAAPVASSGDNANFTDTNLQEAGVDEADIMKTDGKSIFLSSTKGIQIFKAWPASQFNQVAQYPISGASQAPTLYLDDEKLTVIYATNAAEVDAMVTTHILILNVADPAKPVKIRETAVEGHLLASRRIDTALHVAFSSTLIDQQILTPVQPKIDWDMYYFSCSDEKTREKIIQAVEVARTENLKRAESIDPLSFLPQQEINDTWKSIDCEDFASDGAQTDQDRGTVTYTGLMTVDLDNGNTQNTMVEGPAYTVYASPQSLYFAASDGWWNETPKTILHRFSLKNGNKPGHAYTGTGSVDGTVLNSFSMSEEAGFFRIATQDRASDAAKVSILNAATPELKEMGSVDGIGKGESIYAVRFIGKRGYVVTFKKIDPLFVINLTNPTHPTVEGELEMPGFSTYLHPLGTDHLIGLGKDGDDQGTFAWFQGLKLAVFDVTDAASPSIVDDTIIGSRGTTSFALEDHHAFTFDAEQGLLALPLELKTGTSSGSTVGTFQYSGVHLYKVSEDGIVDAGIVRLTDKETGFGGWDNAGPRRVMLMGDNDEVAYILGNDALHQASLAGSPQVVKSIPSDNTINAIDEPLDF